MFQWVLINSDNFNLVLVEKLDLSLNYMQPQGGFVTKSFRPSIAVSNISKFNES